MTLELLAIFALAVLLSSVIAVLIERRQQP